MIHISVTVDEGHRSSINEVAEQLRSAGMQVNHIHTALCMITGSASDGCRPAIESTEGVISVDEELRYQLPPPNAGIQ